MHSDTAGIVRRRGITLQVRSPDGKNSIELTGLGAQTNGLGFKISRGSRPIIDITSFTVRLAEGGELSGVATLENIERSKSDKEFPLPWGKTKAVMNRCERATAHLTDRLGIKWDIDLVAYDDGVAFRYRLPEEGKQFTLTGELGDVRFAGVPTLHYAAWDRFTNDHESEFHRSADGCQGTAGGFAVVGRLAGRAGARLDGGAHPRFFEPLPGTKRRPGFRGVSSALVVSSGKNQRVSLAGRPTPARGASCCWATAPAGFWKATCSSASMTRPGDFGWAKPGKTTWHWWNGTLERGPSFVPGMNVETHKRYIDFCASNGIAYHAVVSDTRPWHVQSAEGFSPKQDTDIVTPRPELQLPEILKYARQRGVGIRLWLHWKALAPVGGSFPTI